ncbi:CHRD domain-containing protein [Candidatus Nitrosacidococcus tergens]|uniref:CHRD domain containing protein n=1 Tax=Candidatus Nitrosacidococcus tergens TaxID=553981 RepID=A0A7G1QBK7_9GAMM
MKGLCVLLGPIFNIAFIGFLLILSINLTLVSQAQSATKKDLTPSPGDKIFKFFLSSDQEVPTNNSQVAYCTALLKKNQITFTVTCNHNVTSPTVAHIHKSPPETDRSIIVMPFETAENPIEQTFTLTQNITNELLSGNLYINVHSIKFPNGEIRGQIKN